MNPDSIFHITSPLYTAIGPTKAATTSSSVMMGAVPRSPTPGASGTSSTLLRIAHSLFGLHNSCDETHPPPHAAATPAPDKPPSSPHATNTTPGSGATGLNRGVSRGVSAYAFLTIGSELALRTTPSSQIWIRKKPSAHRMVI